MTATLECLKGHKVPQAKSIRPKGYVHFFPAFSSGRVQRNFRILLKRNLCMPMKLGLAN
jgi:hypothetical protein